MDSLSAFAEQFGSRCIAHLDMDAFFASVELLTYPELRGLPVVVGGGRASEPLVQEDGRKVFARLRDYAGRGVATTSTYEARKLGVYSAMGLMKSAKLAPEAILLPANFSAYRHYSRLFKQAVRDIAPEVEDRGIDEIYIDLTTFSEDTRVLAQRIKTAVTDATGLTCSIGVSPNKLLSKIASDLDKPNGLTVIGPGDLQRRIWPLPASKINGIGPKSYLKLVDMGIETIGQLAQARPALLQQHFGLSYAQWLLDVSHGLDNRPVVTHSEQKSISRETTFERDLHVVRDRAELSSVLIHLCDRLQDDLIRKGYGGRTIGVKLRFNDFRTVTRDVTLDRPAADAATILGAARNGLRRVTMDKPLRLLGVRIGALAPYAEHEAARHGGTQLSLY